MARQSKFNDILDELIYTSNDLQKIIEEIYNEDNIESSPELIEARHYYEDKVDKIRQELFDLINKPFSNMKKFMVGLGWFWIILLCGIGLMQQNLILVGLAALFPFLIYLVRGER